MGGLIITQPHYLRVAPGEPLPEVAHLAPFKAVVVLEAEYSTAWQNEISRWLVQSGCRYMMAWGQNCSSWDDSVDWAALDASDFADDDSKHVMTTWHENQSLEDVFWDAQFVANFSYDEIELVRALILHISEKEREAEYLALFEQSKTLAERESGEG